MGGVAALGIAVACPTATAQTKVEAMASDATQKRYERKAALATMDIGLEASELELPVQYCKKVGKEMKCSPLANWRYTIDPVVEEAAAREIFDWIVTQRLDRILLQGDMVHMQTARTEHSIRVPHLAGFQFGVGEHESFRKTAEKWLDQRASRAVGSVLRKGVTARYKELPEQERGTFVANAAKGAGMPVEFVGKLMNSAYAFFVYLQRPTGTVTITEATRTIVRDGKKIEVKVWDTSVGLAANAKTLIYHYSTDTNRFEFYSELAGASGGGISSGRSFPTRPTSEDTYDLFKESVAVAIRAVGINLNTELKADDNFAIIFSADSVDGGNVGGDVGVIEDIRVDAPAVITRTIDGVKVEVGFVKAREVSLNCDERKPTQFELVSGESEVGDQLREHPWTGLMAGGGFEMASYTLTNFGGIAAKGGGAFKGLGIGLELDLGYAMNASFLSEVWLDLGGGLGFAAGGFDQLGDASPLLFKIQGGLAKRIYLASTGLFLSPGVQIGMLGMSATGTPSGGGSEMTHSVSSFVLTPGAQLGYNVSPNVQIVAHGGWAIPLTASGAVKVGDGDPEDVDAEADGGLRFGIIFDFHLPVVGPMARFYAKPSAVCREPREEEKAGEGGAGAGGDCR